MSLQEKRGKNLEVLEDGETSETTQATQATQATATEREPKEGHQIEHVEHVEHVEPQFRVEESLHLFWPRCAWLVAMLLVQSLSSFLELVEQ